MALADDVLHLADPACACLHRFAPDSGRVQTYAEGRVKDPRGMAVDRYGTLYVIDDGGASLKVFRGDELVESVPAHRLGLASIAAVAADETRLYLADGPAGRIAMFNILPVFRGQP
jgi:sugar lactone lactonase YvrE